MRKSFLRNGDENCFVSLMQMRKESHCRCELRWILRKIKTAPRSPPGNGLYHPPGSWWFWGSAGVRSPGACQPSQRLQSPREQCTDPVSGHRLGIAALRPARPGRSPFRSAAIQGHAFRRRHGRWHLQVGRWLGLWRPEDGKHLVVAPPTPGRLHCRNRAAAPTGQPRTNPCRAPPRP